MDLIPKRFYLDDFFDEFITSKKELNMRCDIYEKGGDYHIEIDIPGFNKEDISIDIKDNYLTIKAEKNEELNDEDQEKIYIRRERNYGRYERSFYLSDLDQDNIEAEFKNGMLKIIVPKKEVIDNKKSIEIK